MSINISGGGGGGAIDGITGLEQSLANAGTGVPATLADVLALDPVVCFTPESGFYSDTAGTTEQTTDAGTVKCWKDASANLNHATNATGLALSTGVAGGCSALNVNGTAQKLVTGSAVFDSSFDAGFTYFCVYYSATNSSNKIVWSSADSRLYHARTSTTFGPVMSAGSNIPETVPEDIANNSVTVPKPGIQIECFRYKGPSVVMDYFFNGRYKAHTSAASASNPSIAGALHIGGIGSGTGFQWPGQIMAIVIFASQLTGPQIQIVNDYLAGVCKIGTKPQVRVIGTSIEAGSGCSRQSSPTGEALHGKTDPVSQLKDLYPHDDVRFVMDAYAGRTLAQIASELAVQNQAFFTPSSNQKQIVIVNGFTNTLATNILTEWNLETPTSYTSYAAICQTLKDQGWIVGAATGLPRADIASDRIGKFYRAYQRINQLIKQNYHTFAHFLVDLAADPRIGFPGCESDTAYYNADLVHLNDGGAAVEAAIIKRELDKLFASAPPKMYLSKSVAGSANVTLTPAEYATVLAGGAVKFTGTLTGNINVYLPLPVKGCSALFDNSTSGAFTLTLIGATGTGYAITQGKKARAYTDGTNWYQETAEL